MAFTTEQKEKKARTRAANLQKKKLESNMLISSIIAIINKEKFLQKICSQYKALQQEEYSLFYTVFNYVKHSIGFKNDYEGQEAIRGILHTWQAPPTEKGGIG